MAAAQRAITRHSRSDARADTRLRHYCRFLFLAARMHYQREMPSSEEVTSCTVEAASILDAARAMPFSLDYTLAPLRATLRVADTGKAAASFRAADLPPGHADASIS